MRRVASSSSPVLLSLRSSPVLLSHLFSCSHSLLSLALPSPPLGGAGWSEGQALEPVWAGTEGLWLPGVEGSSDRTPPLQRGRCSGVDALLFCLPAATSL
eukprot:492710-Hanusia_phi.AAC.1